jgi:hypothetical protein
MRAATLISEGISIKWKDLDTLGYLVAHTHQPDSAAVFYLPGDRLFVAYSGIHFW